MTNPSDQGPVGPAGPAGPAGKAGEAGNVGREGLAGHIGLPGEIGEQGEPGTAGEQGTAGIAGPRGHAGPALSGWQKVVGVVFVVAVFALLSARQEIQQRSISRNQQTITHNQQVTDERIYRQCVALNVGTTRQNALLDAAVAAERRLPVPDQQRIKDLTQFKLTALDCGPPP